jgi:hypothetical protein
MIGILVHASKAFGIDHNYIHILVGGALQSLLPEPQSFSAGIDSGSYLKSPLLLIQKHPIDKKALPSSIFSYDGNDSEISLFGQGE